MVNMFRAFPCTERENLKHMVAMQVNLFTLDKSSALIWTKEYS